MTINLVKQPIVETELEGTQLEKALALLKMLDIEDSKIEGIEVSEYNESEFTIDGAEYLVLDEEERETETKEYIEQSLWAFNPSFLAEATDWDLKPVFEAMVKADMCESANEPILCLVEKFSSLEALVELAVSYDGYGHFISHYDGCENEENGFYIYRTN